MVIYLSLLVVLLESQSVLVVGFDITLLHTNDVHARIEQMNKYGGQCSVGDATSGKCYGGFARLKTKIGEIRTSRSNTLLLDGGDQYSGTVWFYKFRGAGIATFTNLLGYDAMAIGNHEFDEGPTGLVPFLDGVNFTVLSANIRLDSSSPLVGKFKKSHVFTVGGEKIGVIGYTTPDTKDISNPGPLLTFEKEVVAIRREVTSLRQQGVNKIIALGHSGFDTDKDIAASVDGVDVVIGGHDNTFLYKGQQPSNEEPKGEYPYLITQSSGAKVLVVQDYTYGKYLGELRVTFDDQGFVTSWDGNPILLDNSTVQDPGTLAILKPYRQEVVNVTYSVIGRSHVRLIGEREVCRRQECNMGNLITDSMVRQNIKHSDSLYWNNVSIAILNSGGIRSSIDKGDITMGEVGTVLPFSSTIDIVELYGRHLLAALEHSVSKHNSTANTTDVSKNGGYLQVSGLRIEYDLNRPSGDRVRRARALCTRCAIPKYEDIRLDDIYQVILTSFLARGGDKYEVIRDNKIKHHLIGDLDLDVLVEYINQYSPIIQALEERSVFIKPDTKPCPDPKFPSGASKVTGSFSLVWLAWLLGRKPAFISSW